MSSSRAEVLTCADIIDWYAEEGRRAYGRVVPGRQKGVRQIVLQEPVGVVAAFTPWNFPTLTPVRKIAGALAAGCSIIIKASEETPGGCVELVEMFRRCRSSGGRAQSGVRRAGRCVRTSHSDEGREEDLLHRLHSGRQASRRRSPPRA